MLYNIKYYFLHDEIVTTFVTSTKRETISESESSKFNIIVIQEHMKNYHAIGESFNVTYADGVRVTLVARECESIHDERWNADFRKTCEGCYFCKVRQSYCSGHPYREEICREGGCKNAKCAPEFRQDGKFIHYKRIVRK